MSDTVWRKQNITTRSVSAENMTGEKGKGGMATHGYTEGASRELGQGWKVSPFLSLPAKTETQLALIDGPGMIKHIWFVPLKASMTRDIIFRIYWDDDEQPAVECPAGDFFASPNDKYLQINSTYICRNPYNGMNCYFEMPFRKRCRITVQNLEDYSEGLAFQIDYELRDIPEDALYFHAQFYRENPADGTRHFPLLDAVEGKGAYIGTFMYYGIKTPGWWGEGEIKFYLDGDGKFPTVCGTGTEDYFCGSYCFADFDKKIVYQDFSGPYTGFFHWPANEGCDRFSMYRWHVTDPVYFDSSIRADIQLLGWQSEGRYLQLTQDDVSAVSYFYLDKTSVPRRPLPDLEGLRLFPAADSDA